MPEIDSACIKIERNYRDLINRKIIDKKSDFVEKLTHDSFIVQVERITDRYQTKLDKLLSVFEQTNFTDNSHIVKQYNHNADVEEVKIMTNILHHTGTDPNEKKRIENEQEAWRTINAMFEEKENEFQKTLNEKDKTIIEKDKAISEKDKAISEKDKIIDDLMKKLNEK